MVGTGSSSTVAVALDDQLDPALGRLGALAEERARRLSGRRRRPGPPGTGPPELLVANPTAPSLRPISMRRDHRVQPVGGLVILRAQRSVSACTWSSCPSHLLQLRPVAQGDDRADTTTSPVRRGQLIERHVLTQHVELVGLGGRTVAARTRPGPQVAEQPARDVLGSDNDGAASSLTSCTTRSRRRAASPPGRRAGRPGSLVHPVDLLRPDAVGLPTQSSTDQPGAEHAQHAVPQRRERDRDQVADAAAGRSGPG